MLGVFELLLGVFVWGVFRLGGLGGACEDFPF